MDFQSKVLVGPTQNHVKVKERERETPGDSGGGKIKNSLFNRKKPQTQRGSGWEGEAVEKTVLPPGDRGEVTCAVDGVRLEHLKMKNYVVTCHLYCYQRKTLSVINQYLIIFDSKFNRKQKLLM